MLKNVDILNYIILGLVQKLKLSAILFTEVPYAVLTGFFA